MGIGSIVFGSFPPFYQIWIWSLYRSDIENQNPHLNMASSRMWTPYPNIISFNET